MLLVSWPEIESFHNVRLAAEHEPSILGGRAQVAYRGKVKLHGTNAAVQVHPDGSVVAQSRTAILTAESDNAGFARWVAAGAAAWRALTSDGAGWVVFGEWCGPGIQSGVAINKAPRKVFAVFAAAPLEGDELVVEPEALAKLVGGVPDVHVLPWHGEAFTVDWTAPAESLRPAVDAINATVVAVEARDPWVHAVFGVEGVGEGLVYYPVSHPGRAHFGNLVFKAKGEQHRVVRSEKAAQVDPAVASGAEEFATLVLTEARLEQGARAVTPDGAREGFDVKRTGAFLGWITADVQKETQDELRASGLAWKQVQKAVTDRARGWYMRRATMG